MHVPILVLLFCSAPFSLSSALVFFLTLAVADSQIYERSTKWLDILPSLGVTHVDSVVVSLWSTKFKVRNFCLFFIHFDVG